MVRAWAMALGSELGSEMEMEMESALEWESALETQMAPMSQETSAGPRCRPRRNWSRTVKDPGCRPFGSVPCPAKPM